MSTDKLRKKSTIFHIFLEFSMPLILGVVVALVWANADEVSYRHLIHYNFMEGVTLFSHELRLHFLVNDVFMVLFFAIAAVEITRSFQPGGPLHSVRSAINPLFGTLGGVLGPIGVFFVLVYTLPLGEVLSDEVMFGSILNGWGIPTATDIALAWLATSLILGRKHPAIAFLLLLAIVDDALGLIIIAVFYPSPEFPVEPLFLGLNVMAIVVAYGLRKFHVHNIWAYIVFAGIPSWIGLLLAHLHPALAFVVMIPFMPDTVPEALQEDGKPAGEARPGSNKAEQRLNNRKGGVFTPSLTKFERVFEVPVALGLFFFGLVNAGVGFSSINMITWIIFLSLFIGKTVGIFSFSLVAVRLGYPFPKGINVRVLIVIGIIAGMGLTVALFITGEAYPTLALQNPAKMGALFSAFLGGVAFIVARLFKLKRIST